MLPAIEPYTVGLYATSAILYGVSCETCRRRCTRPSVVYDHAACRSYERAGARAGGDKNSGCRVDDDKYQWYWWLSCHQRDANEPHTSRLLHATGSVDCVEYGHRDRVRWLDNYTIHLINRQLIFILSTFSVNRSSDLLSELSSAIVTSCPALHQTVQNLDFICLSANVTFLLFYLF